MDHYDAVKSLVLSQLAKRPSESIVWNLSGSTLIHILIIMGLGFYVTQPDPVTPRHTISINLSANTELSAETQVGKGQLDEQATGKPVEQKAREIVHINEQKNQFTSGEFELTPQNLMNEIKENNSVIEETERVGFLGVYDVHPAYRQYQQYWQKYVSNFGTKNYPKGLLDRKLNGTLELDIAIDRQGNVRSTEIHRSSGNVEIDKAAIRIARLASPYAPLPEEMAKEVDILHIIRTWEFNNNTLTSRAKSSDG